MERCSTCKHWQRDETLDVAGYEAHRMCYGDGAEIVGSESVCGPFVSIYTLPDFGCVLHEPIAA